MDTMIRSRAPTRFAAFAVCTGICFRFNDPDQHPRLIWTPVMKTLKYEEVHRNEYRDLAEARASIREFLEKIYNQKRLHSALGYLPPAEFEANLAAQKNMEAATRQLSL